MLPAALALHSIPAGGRRARKPPRLQLGDTVGLVEPASFSDDPAQIEAVQDTIRAMGLVPRVGRHVGSRHGYLAGTDRQRAADLNAMFADDEVRAVFAVRGGWGSARLLPFLDWKTIRANPKLLIGFSDITALHLAFAARAGFPTIHSPNAGSSWQEVSWNSLWHLAFAGAAPTFRNPAIGPEDRAGEERWRTVPIRSGKARGRLLGGNLSVLTALVGTPWLPDFDGAILFLEDTGEAEYRIDRMLSQLALSGILDRVDGVVFGHCTRCASGVDDYAGFTIPELLDQYLAPLGVPAFRGANIGHIANQLSLPVGVGVEIDADLGTIRILEPVVA
ncbi:LD-carboxypeptidase [Erythrobacter sp. QSSC1-22B]|nr:LD-carboxypeptidase [Erythrobacter sp. QSSC1-22B]